MEWKKVNVANAPPNNPTSNSAGPRRPCFVVTYINIANMKTDATSRNWYSDFFSGSYDISCSLLVVIRITPQNGSRKHLNRNRCAIFFRTLILHIDKVSFWYIMCFVSSFSGLTSTQVILAPRNDPAFSQGLFYFILIFFDVGKWNSHDWTT